MYPDIHLHIDGQWRGGANGGTLNVVNPATGDAVGTVPVAETSDLDQAAATALKGFREWSRVSAFDRYKLMRKAADNVRARVDEIADIMTTEQGKPLGEARLETLAGADVIDWFAEEARRTYGRIVPPRAEGVYQLVIKEPVGPCAAFTPWNFPINQAVRKVSAALAAGCSVILKGPEETPGSCAALVQCYLDAGLPPSALGLVFGKPAMISEHLIAHDAIRKISFTGSTVVGKHLAMLAGKHMKRATMELGGHAPVIVMDDADVETAIKLLSGAKFRNAGQICTAPTRFLVQEKVYDRFVDQFIAAAKSVKVGDGKAKDSQMGPLANVRRLDTMQQFVADAVEKGAKLQTGGRRIGNKGFFYEPTVLTDVPLSARIMNEEPFGPIAPIARFKDLDGAISEANRLSFGLAAYAYTRSTKSATAIGARVESGMISINHHGLALPEVPFGGIKDSGYGSEGGSEAIEAYLNTKFVSQLGA